MHHLQERSLSTRDFLRLCAGVANHMGADLEQMYRRVLFTILMGNRDDHLRNHGFLREGNGWRLSPAFDINPNPEKDVHALAQPDRHHHLTAFGHSANVVDGTGPDNHEEAILMHHENPSSNERFPWWIGKLTERISSRDVLKKRFRFHPNYFSAQGQSR